MSRDIDRIISDVVKNQENLDHNDRKLFKDINNVSKDISLIKKELQGINNKIDLILEIMNNLTIMVLDEEDEDEEDTYNKPWIPEQEEEWNSYEDDELDG